MDMDFATIRRTTIIALFADDELAGMFTHGKDSCSCRARHALNNQLTDSSQTYVAHRNQVVIGYYTLVYGNISLNDCPPSIREGMPSAFPVPVMVFARWAVDQNEQNKGIGRALLKDAFLQTAAAADIGGLRAILVDALNGKMVMEYKNLGFIECPVGERKLMISIQDVRASLG